MKYFVSRFIVFGTLLAAPFALQAQQTNATVHRLEPPKGAAISRSADANGIAVGRLVLDEQQRASYQAAMKKERARMAELESELLAARQDMLVTSVTQKFDENVIRQKALAAARVEAEIAVIRAKVLSEVQPPLSPEQIEKIKGGQSALTRPLMRQQLERPAPHTAPGSTNEDLNGLPPKK